MERVELASLDRFEYVEAESGYLFSGEAHDCVELLYVDGGALHSVADGIDLLLRQGEMTLYTPGQWHMHYAGEGETPRFVSLVFRLEEGDLSALQNRRLAASQGVVSLLRRMLREQERQEAYSGQIIHTAAQLLLLLILQESATPLRKLRTDYAIHSENEIIRRTQQYVSAHVRDKLSVPMVARKVDVSPSYLTALFHKHLEISPGEYIRRVKLQESKKLIRQGNLNFTEIAAALQYSTVHHFSRQFKDKFGITPTEYAKSVR